MAADDPYFSFHVVNASSRERGLQRAGLAADKYFFPEHLYSMIDEELVRTDSESLNYSTWTGTVRFKALSSETAELLYGA